MKEKKWILTLEVDRNPTIYEKTQGKDICIEIDTWSDKRSLNANSYFHVLVGAIAKALHTGHIEIHNWLIAEYGQIDYELGYISLDDHIDWRRLDGIHLQPTTEYIFDGDQTMRKYRVMRGSHSYNTKDMAHLIDGAVSEAQELGIETMTPDELERMKQLWKAS